MKRLSDILLVDDEPLMLNSLKGLLEFDYKVHTATSGFAALEVLRQHPIKVVISDERMPEMPGHELLRQVKSISPNTIRVLLTGYADLDSVMKSVNSGEVFRYLNKPCRPDTLRNIVSLGVQIYDRMSSLQKAAAVAAPQVAVNKNIATPDTPKTLPDVLFIGYQAEEVLQLTAKLRDNFLISAAHTIDDAMNILMKKPISVIVSELQLGEYDGLDFLQVVREEQPQAVIIVLTDTADVKMIARAVNELQVFKYLTKPTSEAQIEQVLTDATMKSELYQQKPEMNLQQTAKIVDAKSVPTPSPSLREQLQQAQKQLNKS